MIGRPIARSSQAAQDTFCTVLTQVHIFGPGSWVQQGLDLVGESETAGCIWRPGSRT